MDATILLQLIFVVAVMADINDDLNVDADTKSNITHIDSDCLNETGADEDLVQKFDEGEFTDDEKVKCTHKCIFVKLGVMNENGDFDKSALHKIIPKDEYETADDCISGLDGEDVCDTASQAYKCYVKHVLKNGND